MFRRKPKGDAAQQQLEAELAEAQRLHQAERLEGLKRQAEEERLQAALAAERRQIREEKIAALTAQLDGLRSRRG